MEVEYFETSISHVLSHYIETVLVKSPKPLENWSATAIDVHNDKVVFKRYLNL